MVYEWLKYLANGFATCDSNDFQLSLRAQFFTQTMISSWTFLADNLLEDLVVKIAVKTWKSQDCKTTVKASASGVDDKTAANFCSDQGGSWSEKNIAKLIKYCLYTNTDNFKKLLEEFGFSKIQAFSLCQNNQADAERKSDALQSTGSLLDQIDLSLASQYGCLKSGKKSCSRFELAGLQIATSIVTLNPPKELEGELKPSSTALDWYPKTDGQLGRVEFQAVAPKLVVPKPDQILKLFYWDNIFAQALVVKAVSDARQGKMDWLQSKFFQTDLAVFEQYMNSVIIESAFGGLTITAPVSDLLYGYESFILTQAKNTNPLLGGDPSV